MIQARKLNDYCNCGSPSQITELNGGTPVISQFSYDLAGRLTNAAFADGYQLHYAYALNGHPDIDRGGPVRVADSSGLVAHLEYADYGALAKVGLSQNQSAPDGYLIQRTFDEYGRLRTEMNRNGVTVTNAYDLLGRLTNRATLDIHGYVSNTVAFAYTARGLTNHTDELGHVTRFVYDAAGRLLSQTNANGEVLQFTYNPSDQLLTLKDGKNQQTSWAYDRYGRVTNKVDAASTEIFRYRYDADNRLTNRWTAAKGDTYYHYDPLGNLTNVDYPGTLMDIVLHYDGLNRLTNVVDAVGQTRFTYTDAGQLLSEDGPWAEDTVSYTHTARRRAGMSVRQPNTSPWTQSYGYDHLDRLTNVTSAAGTFRYSYLAGASAQVHELELPSVWYADESTDYHLYLTHAYDALARLTGTMLHNQYLNVLNQHEYQVNAASQRTRQTFTGGNYVDYTYDNIGQLKTAKGWEADTTTPRLQEQFGYAYDAAWNLQNRTNNALVQTFGVNNRNELTNATRSGTLTVVGLASQPGANLDHVAVSGTGLSAGNANVYADGSWARAGATLANGTNSYTATAEDTYGRTAQDSVSVNLPATVTFTYDANGNLTGDGRRVFEYDYENQLTNVYVASAWRESMKYDAFGRKRVLHQHKWTGSAWLLTNEVRYVYDGMLVVQERHFQPQVSTNIPVNTISYTRGKDLSGSLQGAGGIGGLLARSEMSNLQSPHAYYHADGNGNITAMVNTNGAVVARYSYDPYGNLLGMAGPLAEANTYRFSSKEWHANAGLYYYGFRYYEPNLQRWLNQDPIEEEGGINLHGFVRNKPFALVDSFGLYGNPVCGPNGPVGPSSPDAYGWPYYPNGMNLPQQPPPPQYDMGRLAACLADVGLNFGISGTPVVGPFVPEIDLFQGVFCGDLANTGDVDEGAAGLHVAQESTSSKMNSKGKWVKPPEPMRRWNRAFGWIGKLYEVFSTAKDIADCFEKSKTPGTI